MFELILIVLAVWLQGMAKIPIAHRAIITCLGKRTEKTKGEGFVFCFLRGIVVDLELVDMRDKDAKIGEDKEDESETMTPKDKTFIRVKALIVLAADKENLNRLIDTGGMKKAIEFTESSAKEAIRERIVDENKKPFVWQEAMAMSKDMELEIAAAMMGKKLDEIPKREQDEMISELRKGEAKIKISAYGVIVKRINIVKISVDKEVREAANREAIEREEWRAKKIKLDEEIKRIKEASAQDRSEREARELVQITGREVEKKIQEHKINVVPETVELIGALVKSFSRGEKNG